MLCSKCLLNINRSLFVARFTFLIHVCTLSMFVQKLGFSISVENLPSRWINLSWQKLNNFPFSIAKLKNIKRKLQHHFRACVEFMIFILSQMVFFKFKYTFQLWIMKLKNAWCNETLAIRHRKPDANCE